MITVLTVIQVLCFQLCALPALYRMYQRRSSMDLSIWREVLILTGAGLQLLIMHLTRTDWRVRLSPMASILNVSAMLWFVRRFRR